MNLSLRSAWNYLFRRNFVGMAADLKTSVSKPSILDVYHTSIPSAQNAVYIFTGEWSSKLPGLKSGAAGLFDDARIKWADEQIGGFSNQTILELGPLEAGHTYMFEQLGATSVTSVEANTRAYLKCLVVKEILQLQRSKFLCGDFVEYLRDQKTKFDICVASGVLYHMRHPMEMIDLASQITDKIFLWTHYYDEITISSNPQLAPKFTASMKSEYKGLEYISHRNDYLTALDWKGFCGGSAEYSHWLNRDDIISGLKHFGFNNIQIAFDDIKHVNGPSFAITALRN